MVGTIVLLSITSMAAAFPDDMCAGERYGTSVGCNAGDVSITGIAVAPGTPTYCVGGTSVKVDLDITVNFSQPDRYDIGIFLANDGKDPTVFTTPINIGSESCSVGVLPTTFPFLDLDPNGGLDTCGDGNKNINVSPNVGSGVVRMNDVEVYCTTLAGSGGNLYIPFVVSWDHQASPYGDNCTSIADPVPGSTAKCNSPDVTNPVEVLYGTVDAVVLPHINKTNGVTSVTPGDSIIYTVIITNTTGQPLAGAVFTDPATANIAVSSVTCNSSGGATCPTTTIADMQGAGITIPVMPIDSSVTFTIDATVANPVVPSHASTITNTAYVTVQTETNSATDIDDIIGAVFSDLSTSTKTVVDLNGGEANPGDVLRYTITLLETAGQPVIGSTVIDNIPADVNNFSIVSYPGGSTNNSTGAGTGSNGTGYLNIAGIDVPANGTEIIEFDVTIAAGTPAGTLIDNTVTITNFGGPGGTPIAPTVPVSPSAVPLADNKQLYLFSTAPNTLSRNQPTGTTASVTVTNSSPAVWTGNNPTPLQLDNTIASASASLFLTANTTLSRQVEARMYCSSNPTAYATSGTYALGTIPAIPTAYTFNLTTLVGGFNFPATCSASDHWVLQVDNHGKDIVVVPVSGGNYSRLNLDSSNVIYVENIEFYDAPYPAGVLTTVATPGSVIYIRSIISDPFGSFDITSAIIEITDPNGIPMLSPTPDTMTEIIDSGAATKTYEYAYTIPAAPAAGNWTVKVTANEGAEATVTDDLTSAFLIESIDLETTKSVDNATPAEMANVVYTLTVSNLDATLTATGIQATDLLPAGLSYISDTAPAPTTYDSVTGIWNIGSLAPMSSISMTLTAKTQFGTAGSTITNTATITLYDQYDDDTNNTASVDIVPAATPNLTILKSADKATVNSGEMITYTLVVQNTGSGVATIVELFDNLSPYIDMFLDFDTGTPPVEAFDFDPQTSGLTLGAPVYTYSGPDITRWDITMGGSFAANSQFTLRFKVQVK